MSSDEVVDWIISVVIVLFLAALFLILLSLIVMFPAILFTLLTIFLIAMLAKCVHILLFEE